MMRAAIYARVSSQAQREKQTIESQLAALRPFVAAQGWTLVDTYVDDGRSAKTGQLEHRDGFARLVRDAAAGRFEVLVVADINRLTRTEDMRERAEILGPFQAAGIRIVTPTGGELDLRTMLGELYVTLHAIVAAEENRKRIAAIKAGKMRAISEGRKPAGPTPYGYSYSRELGQWSIDEAAAALVREIFERIGRGESCVMVADDLASRDASPAPRTGWTRAAVYRIVRKTTYYTGEWEADKARGWSLRVPTLLTEKQWGRASAALLAHKKRGLQRGRHFYLLEGLARCACGARIYIRSATTLPNGTRVAAAYVCQNRRFKRGCTGKILKCHEADERVWAALCDELNQPELTATLTNISSAMLEAEVDWNKDAAGYKAHLERLERVESALMTRFRRGTVTEKVLDRELATINRERKLLRNSLAVAERAGRASATRQDRATAIADTIAELRAALPLATPEMRRELLRELAAEQGVTIADGQIRLDLWLVAAGPSDLTSESPGLSAHHGSIDSGMLRIRRVA